MEQHHICRDCHQPFVVPVDLLAVEDDRTVLLALRCMSCDHATLASLDDSELEALDRHLDATTASITADAAALAAGAQPVVGLFQTFTLPRF